MDFFGQQASTRLRSNILLLGFVAALVATALLIHFGIAFVAYALGLVTSVFVLSAPVAALIGVCWTAILAGCFFRFLDVHAGGPALARKFGAVQAADTTRREQGRELLDVVAEVSVAAMTRAPEVFVLRNESSINAFVLGAREDSRALVVTQGALDAFDRDELQAVVAHEFGHIAQGDLKLNMRLLIALGGLMALDEVGRILIGAVTVRSLVARDPSARLHPGVPIGLLMRVLGSVGVLIGKLVRSAFSRQREFLADASAVQYTRLPFALASALAKVEEADDDVPLHLVQGPELAHLCFSGGRTPWISRISGRLFATHPPLQNRIDTIDPHFAVKQRKVRDSEQGNSVGGMATATMTNSAEVHALGLSDRIVLLLPDERSCLAVLFAFFIPIELLVRREYLEAIAVNFDQEFADMVKDIQQTLAAEIGSDRVGIVEHAASRLKQHFDIDARLHVMKKLEQLVRSHGAEDLKAYACLQLIRHKLDAEFPVVMSQVDGDGELVEARGSQIRTFESMGKEFSLLLSLIIDASGLTGVAVDKHYERVLACYTREKMPRRHADEPGIVTELEHAFQTLYVQPQSVRMAFVEHCAEIILHDGRVTRRERDLLTLFGTSLGCETDKLFDAAVFSRAA